MNFSWVNFYDGEIKKCPFCGREPTMVQDIRYPRPVCEPKKAWHVECRTYDCPIYRADTMYYLSKEEAAEAWNRRAENG